MSTCFSTLTIVDPAICSLFYLPVCPCTVYLACHQDLVFPCPVSALSDWLIVLYKQNTRCNMAISDNKVLL